jgi:hypothetical protein
MVMAIRSIPRNSPSTSLYEADFFRWTEEQAAALRENRSAGIDWDNLAEEIETLGRSEKKQSAIASAFFSCICQMGIPAGITLAELAWLDC